MEMIILGIDPGTLVTGFGIIKVDKAGSSVLAFDIIKNHGTSSMPERLKNIYDGLCRVIKQFRPDELAIETAFYGKNVQSALKIGHARGVSMLAAMNYNIPTSEYSPREIKKAVTGNGTASKQQVQFMVKSQLNLQTLSKQFDVSDALAVALCHSFRILKAKEIRGHAKKRKTRRQRNWSEFVDSHPERVVRKK